MAPDCLRKTQLYFNVNKKELKNFEYATQCYTPVLVHKLILEASEIFKTGVDANNTCDS